MSTLFVDESKSRGYTLVAAVIVPADAAPMRKSVRELVLPGQRRLVLERDESIERADRRILYREIKARYLSDAIHYRLEAAHDEPLLWIPDALAWSFTKGGDWKRRIAPMLTGVTVVSAR